MLEALNVLCSFIFIFYSSLAFLSCAPKHFFSSPFLLSLCSFLSPFFLSLYIYFFPSCFGLPSPSSPYALCFNCYFMFVVYCLASHFVMLLHVPSYCHAATLRFCMLLHVPCLLFRTSHLRSKVFVVAPSPLLFCCLLLPCVNWYLAPFMFVGEGA